MEYGGPVELGKLHALSPFVVFVAGPPPASTECVLSAERVHIGRFALMN